MVEEDCFPACVACLDNNGEVSFFCQSNWLLLKTILRPQNEPKPRPSTIPSTPTGVRRYDPETGYIDPVKCYGFGVDDDFLLEWCQKNNRYTKFDEETRI